MAKDFVRAGHRVVLAARQIESCEQAASELCGEGAVAHVFPVDRCDVASVELLVKAATEAIGPIEVSVSAGLSRPCRQAHEPHRDYETTRDAAGVP
jgi:NADP-dependent 3-hydroxy acid dehydrogenase YdfG